MGNPDSKKGYTCQCCGTFIKTYVRKFNSNMALALGLLYRSSQNGNFGQYFHMEDLILKSGYKRCGDFSYLVHYGFIEKMVGKREDGSPRNGYYRITPEGAMFVEQKTMTKESFVVRRGKLIGFEGDYITFTKSLGTKFSYDDLMK